MPNRSANTAAYGEDVAKIDLNLPDDLLGQIDEAAEHGGETREEFLRRAVEGEVAHRRDRLREELEELLEGVEFDLGGKTAAELIREGRDSR
jgi:predicted transcriptional regulator